MGTPSSFPPPPSTVWLFSNYLTRYTSNAPPPPPGGAVGHASSLFPLGRQVPRCRQTDQPLIMAAERSPRAWDCWKSLSVLLFNPYNSAGRWPLVCLQLGDEDMEAGRAESPCRACRAAQPWRRTQAVRPQSPRSRAPARPPASRRSVQMNAVRMRDGGSDRWS